MRTVWAGLLWAMAGALQAQDPAPQIRYISDDTAITLRADRSIDAPVSGLLKSGARVELLETDPGSAYSRVRVAGQEGWVLTRYLSPIPAARERLAQAEVRLAEQAARIDALDAENARLRAVAEATGGSAGRRILGDAQGEPGALTRTLTAVGLVVAGVLTGLLIPLLPGVRRRRPAHRRP